MIGTVAERRLSALLPPQHESKAVIAVHVPSTATRTTGAGVLRAIVWYLWRPPPDASPVLPAGQFPVSAPLAVKKPSKAAGLDVGYRARVQYCTIELPHRCGGLKKSVAFRARRRERSYKFIATWTWCQLRRMHAYELSKSMLFLILEYRETEAKPRGQQKRSSRGRLGHTHAPNTQAAVHLRKVHLCGMP